MKSIMHVDGDAFFAACEVARRPKLKGLPLVIGFERGIVTALTYEAKALGIKRGVPIWQIKKYFPEVIILPSDYETYAMYSEKMYRIISRYTNVVEKYSIDECFAFIDNPKHAIGIKAALQKELGITFSIGIAKTKVLSKIASNWQKPDGLTIITDDEIDRFLEKWPIEKVWGIGPATSKILKDNSIKSAYDLKTRNLNWIFSNFNKTLCDIWRELNGCSIYKIDSSRKINYQSISKTRTFSTLSMNRSQIYAELSKNTENACAKARHHNLYTKEVQIFLKTKYFKFHTIKVKLPEYTNLPNQILKIIKKEFNHIYKPKTLYRATGVILNKLENNLSVQPDLFDDYKNNEELSKLYETVDKIEKKHGKYAVFLGSSLLAIEKNKRKRLKLPSLGIVK